MQVASTTMTCVSCKDSGDHACDGGSDRNRCSQRWVYTGAPDSRVRIKELMIRKS